jgi:hypothetical protein
MDAANRNILSGLQPFGLRDVLQHRIPSTSYRLM